MDHYPAHPSEPPRKEVRISARVPSSESKDGAFSPLVPPDPPGQRQGFTRPGPAARTGSLLRAPAGSLPRAGRGGLGRQEEQTPLVAQVYTPRPLGDGRKWSLLFVFIKARFPAATIGASLEATGLFSEARVPSAHQLPRNRFLFQSHHAPQI